MRNPAHALQHVPARDTIEAPGSWMDLSSLKISYWALMEPCCKP